MDLAQKPVYKLDLAAGTSVVNLTTPLVEGDDRAQTFTLELTDKGAPANLNGYSVTAYFGRGKTAEAEADTIPLSGTVSGNVATITLTESCYSRSCYFSMPIRLSNGATGQKRTYLIVRGTVVKSVDGTIIDPDGSVPSLDDLFAQIAVMERSRQAAEEATEEALAAAARADEAREGIQGDLATLTKDIARNTAPPIVPTVTGEVVTVSDSANRPLQGLRLYGKTTQDGVPTPNSPVPLVNAGAGGNIETTITAKNRFDFDGWKASCVPTRAAVAFGDKSVTITATEADAFVVSEIKVPVVGGKTYTITFNVSDDSIFKTNHLFKNGIVDDSMRIHHGTKYTFVADADAQFYTVRFGIPDAGNTVTFSDIMFVEGVDVLPYEPGAPLQTINVSTPNGLSGVPASSGGNYTDTNGQMRMCDEVDCERGVRIQWIARVICDNTNAVFAQSGMWYINDAIADIRRGRLSVLATHYKAYGTDELRHGNVCINSLGMIVFGNEAYTDEATMRADLAANPATVYYILPSPIETPLSADELAAYRALTSNKPSTVLYNDAGAGLGVDYVADTKNYIDQRIAALLNA